MAKAHGELIITIEKCKGCELCIEACPEQTLQLSETINQKGYRYAVVVNSNCTGCANCAAVCPEAIIKVYRKVDKQPAKAAL
ncbi:MAG: 4Fe-4S dicluster domain-containing protein [Chloroflexota bacterium]